MYALLYKYVGQHFLDRNLHSEIFHSLGNWELSFHLLKKISSFLNENFIPLQIIQNFFRNIYLYEFFQLMLITENY